MDEAERRKFQFSLKFFVPCECWGVLRRRDRIGKFNMPIGLGLFAKTQFEVGDKVAVFNGELFFNLDEFDNERAGHNPYILHSKQADANGKGEWLDCFLTRRNNKCMASVSNSPYACYNTKTGRMAVSNCRLKVSHQSNPTKFSLEAITVIKQNDEILWSYGAQYIYPPGRNFSWNFMVLQLEL
jgi:hypothetical protein